VWPCGVSATVVFGSLFLTRPWFFNWRIIRFEFAGTGLSQEIISGRRLLLRVVCLLIGFFSFLLERVSNHALRMVVSYGDAETAAV
jgi:hypothetical protein